MTNDPLTEIEGAVVSYPDQEQPDTEPTRDLEAPFVWNIRLDSVGGCILTARGNTAAELHDRINDLLDNHVIDILQRTKDLEFWTRDRLTPSTAPSQNVSEEPQAPARTVVRRELRNIDYDLDDGIEDVFDAVRMEVTIHSKKKTPVLNLWDQESVNEKYAPCQVYFGTKAMAELFDDDDFKASDFANARQFLMPGDGKSRAVAYVLTRKNDRTFVNAKSIGPAR